MGNVDEGTRRISEILEDMSLKICEEYCKYFEQYEADREDDFIEDLIKEHCDKCPLSYI